MVTCRGRREGVREVRCLCFNRCDIYTQSHMHRHSSARVSLPRFTLEDAYLQVQKKNTHITKILSSTFQTSFGIFPPLVCKLTSNSGSCGDLMSSKAGKEACFRGPRSQARCTNTSHQLPQRGEKVKLCHVVLLAGTLPSALSVHF